jgi:hypothetical protein
MTQSPESLPISEGELDIKHQEVNTLAAKLLLMLLADLEAAMTDKDLLEDYETKLLGELYARMVLSAYLGYSPDVMGQDAIDGCNRLIKLTEESKDDT